VLSLHDEPAERRATEALFTLSNGWVGVRGDGTPTSQLLVGGTYTPDTDEHLLPGPRWADLDTMSGPPGHERILDLRTGLAATRSVETGLRTLRFASAADPHALALRAEGRPSDLPAGEILGDPGGDVRFERRRRGRVELAATGGSPGPGITVAALDDRRAHAGLGVVERLAAWAAGGTPTWDEAADRLSGVAERGFDRLLAEHRAAWGRRWRDATVTIEGDADDQLAARFSLFHLLSAGRDEGEAAVGARGLTGPAYGGHVFWDADVFVLPALAATRPPAARAMLEYRVRRLAAARAAAVAAGGRGARFPWESATDGSDVTPSQVVDHRGRTVPIRTGSHEVHIVADVAWAAVEYVSWTGDVGFLTGPGGDLLVDTARYWASRVRRDPGGRAHLDGVMGPDEYHEVVDDDAFTNVMARWNLRAAAALVESSGHDTDEATTWRDLADALVDGYDPVRGLYEQFAGYWALEPLLVRDVAPPPIAADVLLGPERVARSQLIKQPAVLMLHHLVPDEVVPGSLEANLDFYGVRTAHGSSLSPAIHAALLARAGRPDDALELFRIASRLDLDDLTGTTAGGLHLGAMGGTWQALAYGFLGLRPRSDRLELDPHLPSRWDALSLRLLFHGRPLCVRADHDAVRLECSEPVVVCLAGEEPRRCEPPGDTFAPGGRRP
jgi:trehalose/maltose hydrolase-like predicted phosphorylase